MNVKQTKFFPPYHGKGKTNLTYFQGKSGVYLIKERGSRQFLYIGYSGSDLYKTITRHFQSWSDRNQIRVTYKQTDDLVIRVILTTPSRAAKLERYLIIQYQPTDNPRIPLLIEETPEEKKEREQYMARVEYDRANMPF